jgi:Protein of unknown function (DUF3122)
MLFCCRFRSLRMVRIVALVLTIGVIGWLNFSAPALANPLLGTIHSYPEADGQVMIRSQQSLRDDKDHSWQVILFKRVKGGMSSGYSLRLVGFPGQEVAHPRPLAIGLQRGRPASGNRGPRSNGDWLAADVTAQESDLTENVGQYDLTKFLEEMERTPPLYMTVPIVGGSRVNLIAPPYVVKEWQQLVDE